MSDSFLQKMLPPSGQGRALSNILVHISLAVVCGLLVCVSVLSTSIKRYWPFVSYKMYASPYRGHFYRESVLYFLVGSHNGLLEELASDGTEISPFDRDSLRKSIANLFAKNDREKAMQKLKSGLDALLSKDHRILGYRVYFETWDLLASLDSKSAPQKRRTLILESTWVESEK